MTGSPTSMNNRRPAGSRECESQGPVGPFANSNGDSQALQVLTRTQSSRHAHSPILSGAALLARDPDTTSTKV